MERSLDSAMMKLDSGLDSATIYLTDAGASNATSMHLRFLIFKVKVLG